MKIRILCLCMLAFLSVESYAWDPDYSYCPPHYNDQPPDNVALGEAVSSAAFWADCSTPPSYVCSTSAYVKRGDPVLLGDTRKGYVCATLGTELYSLQAWLPESAVKIVATKSPYNWAGIWRSQNGSLVIEVAEKGAVTIKVFSSEVDASKVKGTATQPQGAGVPVAEHLNVSVVNEAGCQGAMDVYGPYLVVSYLNCEAPDKSPLHTKYLGGLYRKSSW